MTINGGREQRGVALSLRDGNNPNPSKLPLTSCLDHRTHGTPALHVFFSEDPLVVQIHSLGQYRCSNTVPMM